MCVDSAMPLEGGAPEALRQVIDVKGTADAMLVHHQRDEAPGSTETGSVRECRVVHGSARRVGAKKREGGFGARKKERVGRNDSIEHQVLVEISAPEEEVEPGTREARPGTRTRERGTQMVSVRVRPFGGDSMMGNGRASKTRDHLEQKMVRVE